MSAGAAAPAAAPAASFVERVVAKLSGRRGPQAGDVQLGQRNVFVLPSRAGLLYLGVLAAMLIAAINFRLALGHALTFLLGSVGAVALLHTHRNLSALVLRPGRAEPVFAGQLAEVSVVVVNRTRQERFALMLSAPGMALPEAVDAAPTSEQVVSIAIPTERRGWMQVPRLALETRFPLGIWRAWTWWQPALRVLVYPAPETPAPPLPAQSARPGEGDGRGSGEDDLAGIRPWGPGDTPRRIAWKAMARSASDELLAKHFEGGERGELLLDWHALPASFDTEERLSRLARWVIDADASGARYALRLPGRELEADAGPAHRARCLEALATFGS